LCSTNPIFSSKKLHKTETAKTDGGTALSCLSLRSAIGAVAISFFVHQARILPRR